MTEEKGKKPDLAGRLPPDLREAIRRKAPLGDLQGVAALDLDDHGMYTEAYLLLLNGELGHFRREGPHTAPGEGRTGAPGAQGEWKGEWRPLTDLTGAVIVEGLGMGILRLLTGDKLAAEYRFTLRQAREVGRLQRQVERRISRKEEEEEAGPSEREEKKVRCDQCGRVIPPWSEICPACTSRRKVLTRLLGYLKPYQWRAIAGFSMTVLVTLGGLVRPWLTKPMLDDGLALRKGAGAANYNILLVYILIMAGLMLFTAVAGMYRERLMAVVAARVARDLRDNTYEHLHKLSLSFFSRKPTGSLVTRVTSDTDRISDFVAWMAPEAVVSVLTILGVGAALFLMNWKLAFVVLLPVPIMCAFTIVFHRKLHSGFERLFHRWSVLTAVVADALPGVRVIKAFSQERNEVDRFVGKSGDYYDNEVEMIGIWTLFGPMMQFCTQLGSLLVWIVGGYWAVTRPAEMSPGTLMAFTGYMWMFYGPIHNIAHMDRMLNRAAASVQRIFEILDTEPAIYSKDGAHASPQIQGRIELRNVRFSYDGVRTVLHDVSLKIEPGEMIGLAGPSGGGKTTMINLICRFYDVLEGQILIDGIDVKDYDIESLRRKIGIVLQEPFLFFGTVARNIAYGRPDVTIEEIITAAKAANAHDFIVGFPDGYDTVVGERGHTLSAGERQRISIARAILTNPAILILDEATSSVDTETEKLIQEALERLIAHRTTIAIAHRLSTLRKANRLVVLDKGRIVEVGTHDELSAKEGGVYAKLVHMQAEMKSIIAVAG